MGLLASIFAYLSAVAAIIVFFLMSADALLNHARHQATNPPSELVTAAKINPHKPSEGRRERAAAPLALGYAQEPAPRFGDEP